MLNSKDIFIATMNTSQFWSNYSFHFFIGIKWKAVFRLFMFLKIASDWLFVQKLGLWAFLILLLVMPQWIRLAFLVWQFYSVALLFCSLWIDLFSVDYEDYFEPIPRLKLISCHHFWSKFGHNDSNYYLWLGIKRLEIEISKFVIFFHRISHL